MNLLVRLTLVYLVVGMLLGWSLRAWLRRLDPRRAGQLLVAVALAPFALHALDTAVRIAPRGGGAAAAGYALAALVLTAAGAVFAWRWREVLRLALVPLALAGVALPASWILGAVLRNAGETTDAIPLLVYLGASMVVVVALAVVRLRLPTLFGRARGRSPEDSSEDGEVAQRGSGDTSPARVVGRLVSALVRRLRR